MQTSIFQIRFVRAAFALAFLSGLLQPAFAVPGGNCGAVDRLTVALRFAQVLFPELKGKEFSVTLSSGNGDFVSGPTDTSDFSVRFDKPMWHPTVNGKLQPDTEQSPATLGDGVDLPFDLYFDFIRANVAARKLECHPLEFTSKAGYKQMEKVRSAIDPHPEWSDEEELRVARKLGLRFGPEDKSATLKKLPLNEHAKLYGPLRIYSARFSMNGGSKCTGCSFVYPRWDMNRCPTRVIDSRRAILWQDNLHLRLRIGKCVRPFSITVRPRCSYAEPVHCISGAWLSCSFQG